MSACLESARPTIMGQWGKTLPPIHASGENQFREAPVLQAVFSVAERFPKNRTFKYQKLLSISCVQISPIEICCLLQHSDLTHLQFMQRLMN